MTLAELIHLCDWNEVREALRAHYPEAGDALEALERVFRRLRELSPEVNPMRIHIEEVFRPGLDDAPFTDVSGRDASLNREQEDFKYLNEDEDSAYAQTQTAFALEFTPWPQWLGMAIEPVTLDRYMPSQIVAHCLWEMTFIGLDEADILEAAQELQCRADEVVKKKDGPNGAAEPH